MSTVRPRFTWRPVFRAAVVGAGLFLAACASSQFDGTEYRDDDLAFRLGAIPDGATQVDSNESLLAFQNDEAGSSIAVNARCGVDSDDVPLRALVGHLFLQLTDRKIISEQEFVLDSRAALTTEMVAYLDGVRRHFVVTVMKKDGCVYDFIHVDGGGDSLRLKESRDNFRKMVSGFETL